jgi:hypothetical protein
LELVVNYSDGATYHLSSQNSGQLLDRARFRVPTRSGRDGDAALIGYEAGLGATFTRFGSTTAAKGGTFHD